MSKSKARLDVAVAEDLGIELSSESLTLKEVAEQPDLVDCLILAFIEGEDCYYDKVPVRRYINGMRIKIPKFHSHPIIEGRLTKRRYTRYYVIRAGKLNVVKISKPSDLKAYLLFTVNDDADYQTCVTIPELNMGLRKKPLMFHRRQVTYAS